MLADRAGVAQGLVHYHFGSVQALLAEATTTMRATMAAVGPALAATHDPGLRAAVAEILLDFRALLAGRLDEQGVPDAGATAAVLAAAVDGLVLHRALDPGLTSAVATPPLARIVAKGQS